MRGDHRGRRRLAVGAADRDRPTSAASARPASRRGAPPARGARGPPATSGLSFLTARRDDHDLRRRRDCRRVADRDLDAELAQPLAYWRCRRRRCPAPCSRDCAAPRRCPTCRCRRCRRSGSVPMSMRHALMRHAFGIACGVARTNADRRRAAPIRSTRSASVARRVGPADGLRAAAAMWPGARARSASCCICLASSLGGEARLRRSRAAPPASTSRGHWRSGDRRRRSAEGTRIDGPADAASSAMVEAPARPMTRCAGEPLAAGRRRRSRARRRCRARHSAARTCSISSARHCWVTWQARARNCAGSRRERRRARPRERIARPGCRRSPACRRGRPRPSARIGLVAQREHRRRAPDCRPERDLSAAAGQPVRPRIGGRDARRRCPPPGG